MQKSAYYCDQCKKVIGEKHHISLCMNTGLSGIAIPPFTMFGEGDPGSPANWYVERVKSGFMHFHMECIEKYFKGILSEIERMKNIKVAQKPRGIKIGKKYIKN